MASNRTVALVSVLGFAALVALGAWWLGSRIESPADAAARTAPPAPSPILVPIEARVLSSTIVTRGTGRFGLPQKISLSPSVLKTGPGLITTLPLRNAQLQEGSLLMTASGRPVFVFQGLIPAYRDLVPGISGDDVRQLERALERLGFKPGAVDGVYDAQTAGAVARWYATRKWEPFGATREQTAALTALERDWGDANKARLAAQTTAAAAALAIESARAAAQHSVDVAQAELNAKRAEASRLAPQGGASALTLDAERAKAAHADTAAAAEVAAMTAERALIVLDPRQPATARLAADAKLDLARAAQRKTQLDGELGVRALQRDAGIAAQQALLAEGALRAVRLEGQKAMQAAVDAQKLAALEARLNAERADRLGLELGAAKRRMGVQIPLDEIVFVPAFPVRVEEVSASIGASAAGPVLSLTDNQLAVDSSLTLEAAPLVKPGMAVAIDEQDLGVKARGVVEAVASTPGTRGVDGYHVYFEVRVTATETATKLEGISLRLTIPTESTKGAVLAVPTSALSLSADGTSRVQVQVSEPPGLQYVVVKPGLSAGGFVEVTPVNAALKPGQLVVVGYKTAAPKAAP